MKLRTRLVLALVALSTVGLAVFGVVTYSLYERSLEGRLDDQLRIAIAPLSQRMVSQLTGFDQDPFDSQGSTGSRGGGSGGGGGGGTSGKNNSDSYGGGPAYNTYGVIVTASGDVVTNSDPLVTTARPKLPTDVTRVVSERYATTPSVDGGPPWRLLAEPLDALGSRRIPNDLLSPVSLEGAVMVVAVPTADLQDQMDRLLKIELAAAAALLSALGIGAWLVLRRGLRPLEEMASSASSINAGNLGVRVPVDDEHTEVGQLGAALNTMLNGIEESFDEPEATERRLRQFLADVSHELRTPLTSIQGFAELFRLGQQNAGQQNAGPDDADPNDPARSDQPQSNRAQLDLPVILRRIEEESGRMRVLVDDLLLLARLDQTRPFEPTPVDLAVLAADACTDAVATAPTRPITLDSPTSVVVNGDSGHLRQALANLMTNAMRHTPDGTPIEVTVRDQGEFGSITVRDHGPGLDPEALHHAFDRFWQADSARSGVGAGLGLAIVGAIAEEHGGTASAADALGGGAIFTFTAAVNPPRAASPSPPA